MTGLWTGALSNDSTTLRKDQLFEIALTEYRGKVYGYSRSEFIVNDTLYYIVKRVKGTIQGDVCEVVDDDIISYNFRGKLDKGVKVTSTFRRNKADSSWYLAGTWKTNATKRYYAVSGKVELASEKDLGNSKLFPHLEELKLADKVAFYKDRTEGLPIVKIAKPEKIKTEYSFKPESLSPSDKIAVSEPDLQRAENTTGPSDLAVQKEEEKELPVVSKPEGSPEKIETKNIPASNVNVTPRTPVLTAAVNKIPPPATTTIENKEEKKPDPVAMNRVNLPDQKAGPEKKPAVVVVPKTVVKNPEPTTVQKNDNKAVATRTPLTVKTTERPVSPVTTPTIAVTEKENTKVRPVEEIIQNSATIAGRKSEFSQEVLFKSDSLELSLYDNGEIDGDTVSVYMNGEVIMARQGLKASAIKKTIYLKAGERDDFSLVLFAENLGKYPPNTGLLVVHDGEEIYHLRFSSDLQKSAGIVFRRQK